MKKCPNCRSEVDDNFDICWNCQYSFIDDRVLKSTDFGSICPNCNKAIDSSFGSCPYCQSEFNVITQPIDSEIKATKQINCLRCLVPLNFQGNVKFHEGSSFGAMGVFHELFTNKESFNLYFCPNCGKVEFFLPGYD